MVFLGSFSKPNFCANIGHTNTLHGNKYIEGVQANLGMAKKVTNSKK